MRRALVIFLFLVAIPPVVAVAVASPPPGQGAPSPPAHTTLPIQPAFPVNTNPAPTDAPDALKTELEGLGERLAEIEERLPEMNDDVQRLSSLTGQSFTYVLTIATLLTTVTAFFFSGLVVVLGWLTYERQKEIREELQRRREELTEAGELLSEQRQALAGDSEKLARQIDTQQREAETTRRFVQQVAEGFFSTALLEILGALRESKLLASETDAALRTKVREVEARLFLWHEDPSRVEAAVRTLSAVGSPAAVSDLKRLLTAETADSLRDLTLQSILRIERRRQAKPRSGRKVRDAPRTETSGEPRPQQDQVE